MAKMLPAIFYGDNDTERKIYNLFRDKTPDDWIVIHSCSIPKQKNQNEREFDFVVLAPNLGFFVLEVKGGIISCKDGVWYQSNNHKPLKHGGPFKQAQSGMHLLKRKSNAKFFGYVWGYGVMFQDMDEFQSKGIQESQRLIYDKRYNDNVEKFIHTLYDEFKTIHLGEKYIYTIPDKKDVYEMANFICPDHIIPLSQYINNVYGIITELTKEQIKILNNIKGNPRMLITGPAGTGKTFLAVEAATQACEEDEKVGLFCYNTQLGDWYSSQFNNSKKPLFAGKLHKLMEEHIKKTNTQLLTPDGKDYFAIEKEANMQGNFYPQYLLTNDTFWEDSYPLAMFEALEKEPIVFDKIIIDECQHLLLPWYMEVFNKMLKGGFANGKWYMFGDFTQQSTAHFFAEAELQHILNSYTTNHYFHYTLTVNCRNSKNIADAILKLTGFGAVETPAKLTDCDVPNVEFHQFKNEEDQTRQLEKIINELLSKNNIKPNDITILGDLNKHKPEDFVFNGIRIISYSNKPSNNIRMSCITKFKGIESKVVILIDIDSYQNKRLIYQGMSRATTLLIILESESAKTERSALC